MNRRDWLQVSAAAGLGGLVSRGPQALAAARAPPRDYGRALTMLGAYVEAQRGEHGLPGMTLCVVDGDGFAQTLESGYADRERREAVRPDHRFQIGSISKSFAALCAARLVEAGQLKTDADMRALLPGAGWPDSPPITLANLLEHSSGLPDDAPPFPRATGGRLWSGFRPGSHWSYSNTGYDLIGRALERIEGRPFAEIVRARVLGPLGMAETVGAIRGEDRAAYASGYRPLASDIPYPDAGALGSAPWVDVTFAAGSLASTARDMGRYLRWLIAAGSGRGAPLLSDAAAAAFTRPTIDAPDWGSPGARYGAGLATVLVDGRPLLHHTGGMIAFSSSMHVDPAAGVGCFASTNVGMTGYRPRKITAYACRLMRAVREGAPLPAPTPPEPDFARPADFAGRFVAADGRTITLQVVRGGKLSADLDGEAAPVEPAGEGLLLAHHPRLVRYILKAEQSGGRTVGLWYGPTLFAAAGSRAPAAVAAGLARLAGRYDNDDPWRGAVRVVARPDGLWLDGTTPMVPLPGGGFRVGADDWSPERAWFDAEMDGRPQRLSLSGADYLRRDDAA